LIGSTISHYKVLEKLGGGGMGIVYRATDTRLDRTVALKFLPIEWCQEPLLRERFTREARAASALDHPHICTVFDIGETPQGQLFIAMAHCPGETLKQRILRGLMPLEETVDIAIQIAQALGAAHESGIVHRDIKPANLLITDRDQVKIVDFGLAKLAGEAAVTRQGTVVGTPAYMSPEQAMGEEVDGRADLWALGTVLYEMVVGRRAFAADNEQAILHAITTGSPTPIDRVRAEVPAELQRIIRRCLKKRPEERYQPADELVADLKRFRGESAPAEVVTQTLPSADRARWWYRFKRHFLPLSGAALTLILAASLWSVLNRQQTRHLLVLPFNSPGEDTEIALLCDGLLDTVAAKLSELRRFRSALSIVPTSEVRGRKVRSAEDAHRIFGVDLVVTGSVMRSGNTLRVPLELIDASKLRQMRSRLLTTEVSAEFVLQDRIVAAIEEMLDLELGVDERQALALGGTSNAEAAELFLEARGHASSEPTAVHLTQAMTLYRQALEIDPDYADAMIALAGACEERYELEEDSIWLEHGANYARRAVAVAPDLPAAQVAAGRFELASSSFRKAIGHLERAIALDPLGLDAYLYLAESHEALGEPAAAEATMARAVRTAPDDWMTYYGIGKFFFVNRYDPKRAKGYFEKVIELLPDQSLGYSALGGCLFHLDDREGARELLERAVAIGSDYQAFANLATIEFYEGRFAEAVELYENALEMDDTDYVVWFSLGEARRFGGGTFAGAREAYREADDRLVRRLESEPEDLGLLIDRASILIQLEEQAEARAIVDRLPLDEVTEPESMFALAEISEVLGERTEALAWIERALYGGYPLDVIEDYAAFDDLRLDPRFTALADASKKASSDNGTDNPTETEH
jgi:serine/threonine protein kinase/tetratricopeptide (TPR) repeat protein